MAAFGPMAAGYLYDIYGSYDLAFLMSVFFNLLGVTVLRFMKKPAAPLKRSRRIIGRYYALCTGQWCQLSL